MNQTGKRVRQRLEEGIPSDTTNPNIGTLTGTRKIPMGVSLCRLTPIAIHRGEKSLFVGQIREVPANHQ